MLQVIMNDVWEVILPAEPMPLEVLRATSPFPLFFVQFKHLETGELIGASYDIQKGCFITPTPEFRPREVKNFGNWLGRGAPR